jgi:peptidoglycan/xylan/chitin deacetylase (PgdA/CDA1 family)
MLHAPCSLPPASLAGNWQQVSFSPMSFRLDRLLTLYFFAPLAGLFPPKKGIRIPILMYHSISDDPETGHPYFWINTSPARFAEHMKFLHDNGYKVISLSEAVDLIRKTEPATGNFRSPASSEAILEAEGRSSSVSDPQAKRSSLLPAPRSPLPASSPQSSDLSPSSAARVGQRSTVGGRSSLTRNPQPATRNPVVLTFDDGYRDFYTHAFPVLEKYGFTATVFLPTAFIENGGGGIKGKKHMNWKEVKELVARGVDFGAHTVNHKPLKELENNKLEEEIKGSKEKIEGAIGKACDSFSFPYAFPEKGLELKANLLRLLKQYGFKTGVTTTIGCASPGQDPTFLARIPVNGDDDEKFFQAKLAGTYSWMKPAQLAYKSLKGKIKNS